jgi:hypothetical protein
MSLIREHIRDLESVEVLPSDIKIAIKVVYSSLQHFAAVYSSLQHFAAVYSSLQHFAAFCSILRVPTYAK